MKRSFSLALALVVASCALTLPAVASAADPEVAPETLRAVALAKAATPTGKWKTKLSLGGTGSASSSTSVVGAVDGATLQVGLLIDGEAKYSRGRHDWQNTLKIQHAQTQTPVMDAWVKSTDNLVLESTYLFRMRSIPWIGPFARARLQTQVISGYDIRPGETTVKYQDTAGTEFDSKTVPAETETRTTGPFEPLQINASAGLFANPLEKKSFTLKLKTGAGTQHIVSRGGFALTNYDKDTNTVTLKRIETTTQAGAELEAEANGIVNTQIKWKAKSRFFYPLYSTSEQKFSGVDALNTELTATLSIKLAKWASLDYVVNIKRIPLILDDWQVQHGLLLTTGFNML